MNNSPATMKLQQLGRLPQRAEQIHAAATPKAIYIAIFARIIVLDMAMKSASENHRKKSFLICCNILEKRVANLRGQEPYFTAATKKYLEFRGEWFARL
jgi:hypothetical protein